MHQATITATITDATPGIITALLLDARTDHDTHAPGRKNPAKAAIACGNSVRIKSSAIK
jgi:hypothetical protein